MSLLKNYKNSFLYLSKSITLFGCLIDLMNSFYKIKYFVLLFLLFTTSSFSQLKVFSWNVENLGSSKSNSNINYIAKTIKDYDIVALQEVVAGYGGAQAVAKLADELNRKGEKWDYAISNPTSSSAYKAERYAFLWKTSKVRLVNMPWLEKQYGLLIDREPYYATFEYKKKSNLL
jgi:hypothetical protein